MGGTPDESVPGERWCIALGGEEKPLKPGEPLTVDNFVVYKVDEDGKPEKEPVGVVKLDDSKGLFEVTLNVDNDGTIQVKSDLDRLAPDKKMTVTMEFPKGSKPDSRKPRKPRKPISGQVVIGDIADAEKCSVNPSGPNLEELTIYARGPDGQPAPDSLCTVEMIGPSGSIEVKLQDGEDGVFKFSNEDLPKGEYVFDVTVDS